MFTSISGPRFVIGLSLVLVVVILVLRLSPVLGQAKAGPSIKVTRVTSVDWTHVDARTAASISSAVTKARETADQELRAWVLSMDPDIEGYLTWFFNYFTQSGLTARSLWQNTKRCFKPELPSAQDTVTALAGQEFSRRVLRPPVAEARLNAIRSHAAQVYMDSLQHDLKVIQTEYQIQETDWQRYINDIALLSTEIPASREIPLGMKAVSGVTVAGTALAVRKPLALAIEKQLASGMSSGGATAARLGGKALGIIAAVGLVAWEIVDHAVTVHRRKPILRQNIAAYLETMRQQLLEDQSTGVLVPVFGLRDRGLSAMQQRK